MKKKIGLILLSVFTVLQIATCGINLIWQNDTSMCSYWLMFPITGSGICYPLFIFTLMMAVLTLFAFRRKQHI